MTYGSAPSKHPSHAEEIAALLKKRDADEIEADGFITVYCSPPIYTKRILKCPQPLKK